MKNVMILSGAGLSAESGLKTFRDKNGLWEEYNVMEVCSSSGFKKNPSKVLEFYNKRRVQLESVAPNHAHKVIAKLKEEFRERLFVITQNIDDLLERAGCKEVIHLHGFLPELICSACKSIFDIRHTEQESTICPKCKASKLRHNIVMFEELAPQYQTLYALLEKTSLFVCIGTSGAVLPVGSFAKSCEKSILNNLENDESLSKHFNKVYIKKACEAIDEIAADIRDFLRIDALIR